MKYFISATIAFGLLGTAFSPASAESGVCFFDQTDFSGAAHCAETGTRAGRLDHHIGISYRSLKLTNDNVVRICEFSGFGGRCMLVEADRTTLDGLHVPHVESYEVMSRAVAASRFFNHVGYADSGRYVAGN